MSIPQKDRREEAPDKRLLETIPDNERALGVLWNIEDYKLGFQIQMKEKPLTRRGMSSLSSIYDPLGLAVLVMLEGKRIFQSLCHQNLDWDEQISDSMARQWAIVPKGFQPHLAPSFLESLCPLPSFLLHPLLRYFGQFPPPSCKSLLPKSDQPTFLGLSKY